MRLHTLFPLTLFLLCSINAFAAPKRHWLSRVNDVHCIRALNTESASLNARIEYLKPLLDELRADPLRALGPRAPGQDHLTGAPTLSVVANAHTLLDSGGAGSVYRTVHNGASAAVKISFTPINYALYGAGVHAIMAALDLAPPFYGVISGEKIQWNVHKNYRIQTHIHNSATPTVALVMEEVLQPQNLLLAETYDGLSSHERLQLQAFYEKTIAVLNGFRIHRVVDFQGLYSKSTRRPYLVDFDAYTPVGPNDDFWPFSVGWLQAYSHYIKDLF